MKKINQMNPKVDFYFNKAKKWPQELSQLRAYILECGLNEELKWGVPCYTWEKSNVVLIHAFKEYCAVLFVKGSLLKDGKNMLIQQTKNVQAARQLRFTSLLEIIKKKNLIKTYIKEAFAVEQAGLRVKFKKNLEPFPKEFQNKLAGNPALKYAFESLTPGRKRAYLLYFSAAKQAKTRESRIEKCLPLILDGLGLND